MSIVALTLSWASVFPHSEMCAVYDQHPLFLDRGMYLVPLVIQLPHSCHHSECKKVMNGTFYRGTQYRTITGRMCQNWTSQSPHKHKTTKNQILQHDLKNNFCRNPTLDSNGPWCYTTDPKERWNYCDIPFCSFHSVKRLEALLRKEGEYDFSHAEYETIHTSHSREKRSVLSVFSGIFSLISMGVGISNAVKISELESAYSYLQNNQEKILQSLTETNQAVNMLSTQQKTLFFAIKHLSNQSNAMDRHIMCELDTIKTNGIIDAILQQKVTSDILPIENLHHYLLKEPNLNESIYVEFPRMIYTQGTIELVSVDATKGVVTLLMVVPHIRRNPDGFLYQPLVTPRFLFNEGNMTVEQPFQLAHLIDVDSSLPPPKDREMVGIHPQSCFQLKSNFICKIGSQYSNHQVSCSNYILQNVTDYKKLKNECGYSVESQNWTDPFHSYVMETSTHALMFTNENVLAKTDAGEVLINKKKKCADSKLHFCEQTNCQGTEVWECHLSDEQKM